MYRQFSISSFDNEEKENVNFGSNSKGNLNGIEEEGREKLISPGNGNKKDRIVISNDNVISSPYGNVKIGRERTMPEIFLKKANHFAKMGKTRRIMDILTEESFDFVSFDKQTAAIASALYKRGCRNGDQIIFMMYDIVKLHIFYTGVWRANGIPRACYPEEDEGTLQARVEESRVGWIYTEPELAEMCLRVAEKVYWDVEIILTEKVEISGCTNIYELMSDDCSALPKYLRKPSDPAIIFATSGTTGASKGAVITHEACLRQILTLDQGRPFDKNGTNLAITKGTHMSGTMLPGIGIIEGLDILVMSRISPESVFFAIEKYRPRHLFAFPAMLLLLKNHQRAGEFDLSSLEWCSTGGAPLTPAIEKIVLQLPNMKSVYNIYGLTEVGPVVSSIDFAEGKKEADLRFADIPENAAGKVMLGVEAMFRDKETLRVLKPREIGELCVKCKGNFTGYFENEKATEESFIDGFFRTGDIGFYDENGFIFLVDRAKEIFKFQGNHVSPTEIENVINDHPAIGEVCVIGVADTLGRGHLPRAFCVKLDDVDVTPEEILEFANGKLADFKRLRGGVFFVNELPKGKTGKVTRQLVEQIKIDEG